MRLVLESSRIPLLPFPRLDATELLLAEEMGGFCPIIVF